MVIMSGSLAGCRRSINAVPLATQGYVTFTGPAPLVPSHSPTKLLSWSKAGAPAVELFARVAATESSAAKIKTVNLRAISTSVTLTRKYFHVTLAHGNVPCSFHGNLSKRRFGGIAMNNHALDIG